MKLLRVEHKVLLSSSTEFVLQWMADDKDIWSLDKIFFSIVLKESKSRLFFVYLCIVNIIRMWTSLLFMASRGKIKSFCWKIPRQVMQNALAAYCWNAARVCTNNCMITCNEYSLIGALSHVWPLLIKYYPLLVQVHPVYCFKISRLVQTCGLLGNFCHIYTILFLQHLYAHNLP